MSQAQFVEDGIFTLAAQNGPWEYVYPFADKGDNTSFVAKRKMRQLATSFTAPTLMDTRTFANQYSVTYPTAEISAGAVLVSGSTVRSTPGVAYLVEFTPPSLVDDASGLLEWTEEWASVPVKRLEWGSITYTQLKSIVPITNVLLQVNTTFDAYNIYEYAVQPDFGLDIFAFVTTAGTAFPLPVPTLPTLIAPKIVDLGNGTLQILGGVGVTQTQIEMQSVPILAQDSENSIYRGRIICRHSVWVIKKLFRDL